MLNERLAKASSLILPICIPLTHHTIGDDLNNRCHIVRAVLIKPLHYYGENACQIEFHHIGTLPLGDIEALKNRIEDVLEHSAIHFIHI